MCEEAPLSRIQSCSRMELVEAAAMKAQLYGCWFEEESEREDLCFDFLDDFLWSICLRCLEDLCRVKHMERWHGRGRWSGLLEVEI